MKELQEQKQKINIIKENQLFFEENASFQRFKTK